MTNLYMRLKQSGYFNLVGVTIIRAHQLIIILLCNIQLTNIIETYCAGANVQLSFFG